MVKRIGEFLLATVIVILCLHLNKFVKLEHLQANGMINSSNVVHHSMDAVATTKVQKPEVDERSQPDTSTQLSMRLIEWVLLAVVWANISIVSQTLSPNKASVKQS